jgi:16S rRNA (cytosine1402-N4)-methyltransferase
MDAPHQPIMVPQILNALQPIAGGHYVDGTAGAGGHSLALLETQPGARILAIDRDPDAVAIARKRLANHNAIVVHDTYLNMRELAAKHLNTATVDGILLDLGLSSMQLDQAERGFAFRFDAPLDMRFDPTSDAPTAADLVNELPSDALADILYQYGEEKNSRKIARAIAEARPINTTTQLASLIEQVSRSRERIHPATRSFQALRIAVNDELAAVETVIPLALGMLKPGGRLAILSFHSLEDRIVKHAFRQAATDCICPPQQPICTCEHRATVRLLHRKPIVASPDEINDNTRARSAKLRVAERLHNI